MTENQGEKDQASIESSFLHIGGSVGVGEACYIERKADQDLYESLKRSECCCIFNSRQMGKSSLRVHMIDKLQHEGFYCATIDPQTIGVNSTQEQWYGSVATSLIDGFGLDDSFDLDDWISEHQHLSPIAWLDAVLGKVLLTEISAPIVIFVEEIDSLRSLSFSIDDFFVLIRSCYERRAHDAKYNRLNFVLIGVTTPRDLIRSNYHSNFNIGREIELTGFRLDEASAFLEGMRGLVPDPKAVLSEVLSWTGGQPFLTQKLLSITLQYLDHAAFTNSDNLAEQIGNIVQAKVIDNWESQDQPEHLRTLQDRILQIDEGDKGVLLGLYKQILENGSIVSDDNDDEIRLRLTGLVMKDKGRLRIYNPIYKLVFDLDWAETSLASLRPKLYDELLRRWRENNGQTNSSSFLLTGDALKEAQNWFEGKRKSKDDENFLAQSQKAQDKLTTSRLTLLTSGLFIGLFCAAMFVYGFNLLRRQAVQQEAATDVRRLIGESRRSQERGYPDESLESAIRAVSKLKNSNNDAILTAEANLNLAHLTSIYRPRLCRWSANPNASGPISATALAPWNESRNKLIASAAENQDPLVWKYNIDSSLQTCTSVPLVSLSVPNEKKTSGTTRSLLFSQDGLRLAGITSTRENVFVRVWDLGLNPASRLVLNLTRNRASSERLPRLLAITPDNTYLAMGSIPGQQIEIIDLKSKTTVLSFNEKVTSLSIRQSPLPPLNQLAWVTSDGLLKIISIPSRGSQRNFITPIQNRPLTEYSRGGRYLAVAGTCTDEISAKRGARGNEKEFISLYDLNSDQKSPSIVNDKRLKATNKPLNCMDLSLSSAVNTITFLAKDIDISNSTYTNMPILATTRRDGTIRLWSFAKQVPGDSKLLVLTDLINAGRRDNTNSPNLRVSPNGDFYIATNVRNMISIRSPLSATPDFSGKSPPFFYDLTPEQSGASPVNAISFSDDSKHMALTYANPSKSVSIFSLPIDRGSKPDNVQYVKLPLAGWMFDQKNRTIKPGKYSTYTKNCDLNRIEARLRDFGIREDNPNRLLFFNKNARLCLLGPFLVKNTKSVSESAIGKYNTEQELKIFSPNDILQLSLPDIMDAPIQSFNDSAISQDGKMLMTANDDGTVGIWNISQSQSNNRKDASDSRNFLSINLNNIPLFALAAALFQSNHQKIPTAAREFLPISLDNKPLVALATANVNPKHGGDQWFAIAYENNNIRIFKLFDGLKKSACDKLAQSYQSGQTDQSPDSSRLAKRWQQLNDEKICNSSMDTVPMDSFRTFIGRRMLVFLK